ncbi:hypothetical protein SAMN05444163_8157 [Bradyrhizobium ottawaense]|uniref:Uncharacterized protein n=1 Tax=Bradyrhizobium ottawaense TaxID=931866 RepID=A0ABY0QHK4_9BRAD|nr:hypothetical protein SAMN05444163_8157 [Bradyrhizobium ottawaense]
MKFYTPIICGVTGFWGGDFHCLAPSLQYAFRLLERRIVAGKIKRRPY